jgi:hypothetical protein
MATIRSDPRVWDLRRILGTFTAIPVLFNAGLLPDNALKAEEAASTLFRFFRSKHVSDLRTIC